MAASGAPHYCNRRISTGVTPHFRHPSCPLDALVSVNVISMRLFGFPDPFDLEQQSVSIHLRVQYRAYFVSHDIRVFLCAAGARRR